MWVGMWNKIQVEWNKIQVAFQPYKGKLECLMTEREAIEFLFVKCISRLKSERVAQSCLAATPWTVACEVPLSMEFSARSTRADCARIQEQVAIPFSKGSSKPRSRTWVSCIAGKFFTIWATREAHMMLLTGMAEGGEIFHFWDTQWKKMECFNSQLLISQ